MPRENIFSYSYLGILFAAAKNAEIRGLVTTPLFSLYFISVSFQKFVLIQKNYNQKNIYLLHVAR